MGKLKLKEGKKFNLGYIAKSGVEVKLEFKIFQFKDSYVSILLPLHSHLVHRHLKPEVFISHTINPCLSYSILGKVNIKSKGKSLFHLYIINSVCHPGLLKSSRDRSCHSVTSPTSISPGMASIRLILF